MMKNFAIFASGSGSNAEALMRYFKDSNDINVSFVLSNKADALVLEKAKQYGKPAIYMPREEFNDGVRLLKLLEQYEVELVVLAGFLLFIPDFLTQKYARRIINIHPSLLPKYGGKGMYGIHVHQAVLEAGERETGITIHEVNHVYDAGKVVFQTSCPVCVGDTPELLARRVLTLEHAHYPRVVEEILLV